MALSRRVEALNRTIVSAREQDGTNVIDLDGVYRIKLEIHEAFKSGEITAIERDALLRLVNESSVRSLIPAEL